MTDPDWGRRNDGKPYAEGNTREDGSFEVGKGRPDPKHQFRAGDGRPRGRRPKGTKNLAADWREELCERITITENGKKKRVTKQRAIVKTTTAGAMKGGDRKIEIALRRADEAEIERSGPSANDEDIVAAWMGQQGLAALPDGKVGDDDPGSDGDVPGDPV